MSKLIDLLEKNPCQGVALGNNFYKIRIAITSKGKGKSGGARVISYVKVVQGCVYLASIFDKSEKSSISDEALDEIFKLLSGT